MSNLVHPLAATRLWAASSNFWDHQQTAAAAPSYDQGSASSGSSSSFCSPLFMHQQQQQQHSSSSSHTPCQSYPSSSKGSPYAYQDAPAPSFTAASRSPSVLNGVAESAASLISYFWLGHNVPFQQTSSPLSSGDMRRHANQYADVNFARFLQGILGTTQVCHSVIVMAILFIWKTKQNASSSFTPPGTQYQVAIPALMLANKMCDDHTYTAKTWADISGISKEHLVACEQWMLRTLDFSLAVSSEEFGAWEKLLSGLGLAATRRREQARMTVDTMPSPYGRKMAPMPTRSASFNRHEDRQRALLQQQRDSQQHPASVALPSAPPNSLAVPAQQQVMARKRSMPNLNNLGLHPVEPHSRRRRLSPHGMASASAAYAVVPSNQGQPRQQQILSYPFQYQPVAPSWNAPSSVAFYTLAAGQRVGVPHSHRPAMQHPYYAPPQQVYYSPCAPVVPQSCSNSPIEMRFAARSQAPGYQAPAPIKKPVLAEDLSHYSLPRSAFSNAGPPAVAASHHSSLQLPSTRPHPFGFNHQQQQPL